MLWIGIWVHPYTVITLAKLAQILVIQGHCGYYEMMEWWHYWGCRPPLTAPHIHIWCMKSAWAPSFAVDKHMGAPSLHSYTGKGGPDFGNFESLWLWNDSMMTLLRQYTITVCFPHSYWIFKKCLSTIICCGRHMGAPLHSYYTGKVGPDFGSLRSLWLLWNDGMMTLLRL